MRGPGTCDSASGREPLALEVEFGARAERVQRLVGGLEALRAAHRAGEPRGGGEGNRDAEEEGERPERRQRDGPPAAADRRRARLAAQAAQRQGARLGGDARDHPLEELGGRGREQARAREPAAGRELGQAGQHLAKLELAVAAGPEDRAQDGRAAIRELGAAREQHRVAQGTREPRLVAVRERVAAHVDEDDRVAAEALPRGGETVGDGTRPAGRVDEQRRLAGKRGHPRLGEGDAALGDARVRPGEHEPRPESLLDPRDLVERARPGVRVDHEPLPRRPADHRPRPMQAGERLGDHERADHVTAAAHAHDERAPRGGEEGVGVEHGSRDGRGRPALRPGARARRRSAAGRYLTKPSSRRYWRATSSGRCLSTTTRELSSIIARSVSGFWTRSTTLWASGPSRRAAWSRTRKETL